jgi:FMN phosphatase YigB (HAD superfamily)
MIIKKLNRIGKKFFILKESLCLRDWFDFVFIICYSLFLVPDAAHFEIHTHRYGSKNSQNMAQKEA